MRSTFEYARYTFESRLNNALREGKKVLDVNRCPVHPGDVQHSYEDKYHLVELATGSAITASINILEKLGLSAEDIVELAKVAETQNVILNFESTHNCAFDKTVVRDVDSKTKGVVSGTFNLKSKTVTTIVEHFWKFSATWNVRMYGSDKIFKSHSVEYVLKSTGSLAAKDNPKPLYPECEKFPCGELNLTWLLKHVSKEGSFAEFSIDRTNPDCLTPRRNDDVRESISFFKEFEKFAKTLNNYITYTLFPVELNHDGENGEKKNWPLDKIDEMGRNTFVPVIGMFTLIEGEGKHDDSSLPNTSDAEAYFGLQKKTLETLVKDFNEIFQSEASSKHIVTPENACLLAFTLHMRDIVKEHDLVVNKVEDMLRQQVISAVGKVVSAKDFDEYMKFHNQKLFQPAFKPRGFNFAIGREGMCPEGVLSLESTEGEAIQTISMRREVGHPMKFPLNAAVDITLLGDHYVHATVFTKFAGEASSKYRLVARARQFSSFILLVGKIPTANTFEPSAACVIQNKDDLRIPLLLETIPTPKEFKDAIESLSPEQQRFCKAFRKMQLSSTLFGVCVIQIKPQLERVLNLPPKSLTKEIALCQDLMKLLGEYQIPSDLLKFDEENSVGGTSGPDKLFAVKGHVNKIKKVIEDEKNKELEKAKQDAIKENMDKIVARSYEFECDDGEEEEEAEGMAVRSMNARSGGGGGNLSSLRLRSARPHKMKMMKKSAAPRPVPRSAPRSAAPPMVGMMMAGAAPPPAPTLQAKYTFGGSAPQKNGNNAAPPQEATNTLANENQTNSGTGDQGDMDWEDSSVVDYTAIPNKLDANYELFDEDSCLRPTKIKTGRRWTKFHQPGLLSPQKEELMNDDSQKDHKNKAFDLLDALSRSGTLDVEDSTLHVVLAATHCFDKSIMNTLVKDNVNPIERVERSELIVATTIHDAKVEQLVNSSHIERLQTYSAQKLMIEN